MNSEEGRLAVSAGEIAQQVVAMAVWAPSVHNTQPWWFASDGRQICLYADARRQLLIADPHGREMLISCGAALFTARLALRSLGYVPDTSVLPEPRDPDLLARISWPRRAAVTAYESDLAAQVRQRRTHRAGFEALPLPDGLLPALQSGAERDGTALHEVSDAGGRSAGTVCLLTTPDDRPADWLNAGQALQRILLTAAVHGIATALHRQPTEVSWLRDNLRAQFCDGAWPQLVLRFGAAIQMEQSVRRATADVLRGLANEKPMLEPPPCAGHQCLWPALASCITVT